MARNRNTNQHGSPFSPSIVTAVWGKAQLISGEDALVMRMDSCGATICYDKYGDTTCPVGWEIDHIQPIVRGGDDSLDNLQPLQWENNRYKHDDWPNWTCLRPPKATKSID